MAPISLASIHLTINWVNTRKQNGCHAPLISDYSSASKYLLARKCDVALERYCMYIFFMEQWSKSNALHCVILCSKYCILFKILILYAEYVTGSAKVGHVGTQNVILFSSFHFPYFHYSVGHKVSVFVYYKLFGYAIQITD